MEAVPPRPPSLIRNLATLPIELVHQILSDLPLSAVLKLAAHDVPYIDDCILAHIQYRRLFPSERHLTIAKAYYRLYARMIHPIRSHTTWRNLKTLLSMTQTTSRGRRLTHVRVTDALHSSIQSALESEQHRVALLAPYSDAALGVLPPLDDLSPLQERHAAIEAAQQTLNALRASQLRALAHLLDTYPNMLKSTLDPSQERRVHGAVAKRCHLLRDAERITRLTPFGPHRRTKRVFRGNGWLPIVPYDRYLRLFLKVVERYPPNLEVSSRKPVSDPDPPAVRRRPRHKPTVYSYPPTVATKIIKTMDGLNYVYTPDHFLDSTFKPHIIRTMYTPFSCQQARGLCQPAFAPEERPRVTGTFFLYREEEIEWLEAFLQSCEFMSGMDEARWSATETVAQMWDRKSSV